MSKNELVPQWSTVQTPEPPARTDRDEHGHFLAGNGGGGRKRGSRNKLSETFLETVAKDFADHGADAVMRLREEDPATYLKLIAWLIPRELILKREEASDVDLAELTEEEVLALIEAERRRQIIRRAIGKTNDQ